MTLMTKNKIITLITDFGTQDPFVGIMKGVIYNINPEVHIVDLTHHISPHDAFGGAFTLLQSFSYFPSGTIHIAVVDPGVGGKRRGLIVESDKYLFVIPDNGIVSLAMMNEKVNIFEINNTNYFLNDVSNTFHGRDIFAPVGAYLSKGIKPIEIGVKIDDFNKFHIPEILQNNEKFTASIIHIDKFGNLITNIDKSYLINIKHLYIKNRVINRICHSYDEVPPGELLAIFGSTNLLEISVNQDNAAVILQSQRGDPVYFDFE